MNKKIRRNENQILNIMKTYVSSFLNPTILRIIIELFHKSSKRHFLRYIEIKLISENISYSQIFERYSSKDYCKSGSGIYLRNKIKLNDIKYRFFRLHDDFNYRRCRNFLYWLGARYAPHLRMSYLWSVTQLSSSPYHWQYLLPVVDYILISVQIFLRT